ncbi:MAG: helix-turn-helix domain-containing protein [bacterium]|nr:helix-turn-helix domain-containing protein [bacterium]
MSIETIKQLGLSDNEAKVYVAALELGQATVQDLGKKSRVKRTTVYTTIEGLKEKGLLAETKKGKKTLFIAQNPEALLSLSEKRLAEIKKALPELKSIYNSGTVAKPKLKFFEGKEGYLAVYQDILKQNPKELLVIASYKDWLKHIDIAFEGEWTKQRVKQGIFLRWLDFKTKETIKKAQEGKKGLREIRFLPDKFAFTSATFIYNGKIILMSGKAKEFMAVIIESQEFYHTLKQFFEMLFLFAKK